MTDICLVKDCWNDQKNRGLCSRHYRQLIRGKDIGVTPLRPINPKVSGRIGGKIGGKAKVPKGFAIKPRRANDA